MALTAGRATTFGVRGQAGTYVLLPRRSTHLAAAQTPGDTFAHPVERELALIFDQHGITWEYEPHTFVLERNPDGSLSEAFTPDFFLPELDLYVECTVLRQALTTRKRRKARKLRDIAGVEVQVLYRGDLIRLARRWRLERLARAIGADSA